MILETQEIEVTQNNNTQQIPTRKCTQQNVNVVQNDVYES